MDGLSEKSDYHGSPKHPGTAGLASRPNRVVLNVGGTLFHTSIDTLTDGSSYFKAVFSNKWNNNKWTVDKDGMHTCFVDADPNTFAHILNYLRTHRMPLFWNATDGFDLTLYSRVLEQAHFLLIDSLIEWIEKACYQKAVCTKVYASILDDEHWDGEEIVIDYATRSGTTAICPKWFDQEEYVCPRGIEVHHGDSRRCGRACEKAQGDVPIQYRTRSYCNLVVKTERTLFNHEALEPKADLEYHSTPTIAKKNANARFLT